MTTKYINEVLQEINDDVTLFQTTYKKFGDGGPLGKLFHHAFTPEGKFLLPEGVPPFKPSPEPEGMTPSRFIHDIKKFDYFCNKNLTQTNREKIFIQMLEGIHPKEAKIVIAVKDQELTKLYPNITKRVVAEAGFIPPLTEEEKVIDEAIKKPKRVTKKQKL